jgi:hypothetical protein
METLMRARADAERTLLFYIASYIVTFVTRYMNHYFLQKFPVLFSFYYYQFL